MGVDNLNSYNDVRLKLARLRSSGFDIDVAEIMLFLYQNPDICAQMGNESRRIAEQRFDVRLVNQVIRV